MKKIAIFSFLALICFISALYMFKNDSHLNKYIIVIISNIVDHKPILPHHSKNTNLIIINQSPFTFNTDHAKNEYEFNVIDKSLSTDELKQIAFDIIPKNEHVDFYIF